MKNIYEKKYLGMIARMSNIKYFFQHRLYKLLYRTYTGGLISEQGELSTEREKIK